MLNLEMKEIDYIVQKFTELTSDVDNIDSIKDEEYNQFLASIYQETYDDMNKVIENIDKVNVDEEVNKSCIEGLIWGLSMCVWLDNEDTVDDVRELLGETESEEYYTIYGKLVEVE